VQTDTPESVLIQWCVCGSSYMPNPNPQGKTTLKTGHTWEDNILMDLKETGCGGVNWSHLTWGTD